MENKNLKLVIVGHVDHGKSSLIGRLLYDTGSLAEEKLEEIKKICEEQGKEPEFAFVLDYLEEERQQGITIDTTQIFFKTEKREYVIIDAPGHVEFLKNMITGASQAEAAILIVDCKEGVMEQTKRHAKILNLLGIKQVIVVLNKIDLVEYNEEIIKKVEIDITEFLAKLNIEPKYVIPVSAKTGDNITFLSDKSEWFFGPTVLEALDEFENKKSSIDKEMLFPIQDVYKQDNKRIYVGRVETGILKQGDEITVLPGETTTKIQSIETFKDQKPQTKEQAEAGECIGITTQDPVFIERGNVLCKTNYGANISESIPATIFWMDKSEMKLNDKLIIKLSTQETICELTRIYKKINSSSLDEITDNIESVEKNQIAQILLKTDKPLVIEKFNDVEEMGRFVLIKNNETVAGGIIE